MLRSQTDILSKEVSLKFLQDGTICQIKDKFLDLDFKPFPEYRVCSSWRPLCAHSAPREEHFFKDFCPVVLKRSFRLIIYFNQVDRTEIVQWHVIDGWAIIVLNPCPAYHISDTTVYNVLKQYDIEPAPNRKASLCWSTFLKAHWETLYATDFTTVEVWTPRGLVTLYIMVVMELHSRRVEIVGITTSPLATWMRNVAKELTKDIDGFMKDASHLIMDRVPASLLCENSSTRKPRPRLFCYHLAAPT